MVTAVAKLPASAVDARVFRKLRAKRRVFRKSGTQSAAELIGPLRAGDEICGITNGQFSLVDVIEHVLIATGPADVSLSTWTMGIYDIERAHEFARNRLIRTIRIILDPSMFSRRPELAAILVKGFGADSFRAVNSHAKFAVIRGDRLAVAIRSSMNLNPNNRLESFDITVEESRAAGVSRFFESLVDEIWSKVSEENRSQSAELFSGLLEVTAPKSRVWENPFISAT
jgi:hypothetical protein